MHRLATFATLSLAAALAGCGGPSSEAPAAPAHAAAAASPDAEAVQAAMKKLIAAQVDIWLEASRKLRDAAPEPAGRGWDARGADRDAIERMKQHWLEGRVAYERIEGAIAPLFPESDTATDARYDDFLAVLGGTGDHHPFDDQGIVGMHAIERVLWRDAIPEEVTYFERGIAGYKPARQPATEEEAKAFKHQLAQRLVTDIETLKRQLDTVELDIAFAFRGLIDLAVEQAEKVDRAATGQEESRYAQTTMRDLRANYEGCLAAYRLFQPWLLKSASGLEIDAAVLAAFERLRVAYAAVPGDAIPRPPESWSTLAPTDADRASDFGRLFTAVSAETDPNAEGSLHRSLTRVASALGLPERVTE